MDTIQHLYMHVPFCQSKCDYCAFYSITNPAAAQITSYCAKVRNDIETIKEQIPLIKSLFIGGGTPTLLPPSDLRNFLDTLSTNFTFDKNAECTIECNPESLTDEKIDILGNSCINRISLGIQSFHPKHRSTIGRQGSLVELNKKLITLAHSGIENLSMDLIYGIPGQTIDDVIADLRQAIQFPIHHISTYALSIEDMSRLSLADSQLDLDDDLEAEMWQAIGETLAHEAGIYRYEISNYAQPGFECKHNLAFWKGKTYFGVGPAAVSFTGKERVKNPEDFSLWLDGSHTEREKISDETRARELMALGLRLPAGIEEASYETAIGKPFSTLFSKEIEALSRDKLVFYDGERLVPTEKGLLFADTVATTFI